LNDTFEIFFTENRIVDRAGGRHDIHP
jgi:hypothetical protein